MAETPEKTQSRAMAQRIAKKGRKEIAKKANALKTLSIEYVEINSLQPNSYNPTRQSEHDFELLLRSMEEDGFTQPIVALKETKTIVDGEHRWRAADALGLDTIPVVFTDMTEEQARIATLRHNRARGSEDIDLTADVLRDLEKLGALEWAQDSLMLDQVELDKLLEDTSAPEALAGDEYAESWDVKQDTEEDYKSDKLTESVTPAALTQIRDAERKAKEAQTVEEKEVARKEANIYRISLVFAGEEADIVRQAMGESAAKAVLEMCQSKVGAAVAA